VNESETVWNEPGIFDADPWTECEILCEVDGVASGERVGVCPADGRPVFRSRMAGTIYHATADR
jgi:hypothetical protein